MVRHRERKSAPIRRQAASASRIKERYDELIVDHKYQRQPKRVINSDCAAQVVRRNVVAPSADAFLYGKFVQASGHLKIGVSLLLSARRQGDDSFLNSLNRSRLCAAKQFRFSIKDVWSRLLRRIVRKWPPARL